MYVAKQIQANEANACFAQQTEHDNETVNGNGNGNESVSGNDTVLAHPHTEEYLFTIYPLTFLLKLWYNIANMKKYKKPLSYGRWLLLLVEKQHGM